MDGNEPRKDWRVVVQFPPSLFPSAHQSSAFHSSSTLNESVGQWSFVEHLRNEHEERRIVSLGDPCWISQWDRRGERKAKTSDGSRSGTTHVRRLQRCTSQMTVLMSHAMKVSAVGITGRNGSDKDGSFGQRAADPRAWCGNLACHWRNRAFGTSLVASVPIGNLFRMHDLAIAQLTFPKRRF
jgi:hypothetical protein